jgi:hypothetical protein
MSSFEYKFYNGRVVTCKVTNPKPALEKLRKLLELRPQTYSIKYNRPLTFLEWIGEPLRVDSVYYHTAFPGKDELEVRVRHFHDDPDNQVDFIYANDPLFPPPEPPYIPAHWIKKKRGRPQKNRQVEGSGEPVSEDLDPPPNFDDNDDRPPPNFDDNDDRPPPNNDDDYDDPPSYDDNDNRPQTLPHPSIAIDAVDTFHVTSPPKLDQAISNYAELLMNKPGNLAGVPGLDQSNFKVQVYVMRGYDKICSRFVTLSSKKFVMVTIQSLKYTTADNRLIWKALVGCSECDVDERKEILPECTLRASFGQEQFPSYKNITRPCNHVKALCFAKYTDLPGKDEDFSIWLARYCDTEPVLRPSFWSSSPPLSTSFTIDVHESDVTKSTKETIYLPFDYPRRHFVVAVLMKNHFLKCLSCNRNSGIACKHTTDHIPYFQKDGKNTPRITYRFKPMQAHPLESTIKSYRHFIGIYRIFLSSLLLNIN